MKRSVSKIIRNMFLLLTMAFLIPSIAKAAPITSSGGDGKWCGIKKVDILFSRIS